MREHPENSGENSGTIRDLAADAVQALVELIGQGEPRAAMLALDLGQPRV